MGSITSAGVGSGLPLEDLIKASLDAKKAQFERFWVDGQTDNLCLKSH